ncbi:MAG: NACHT domain-containing protein [Rivularia sp. (in: cyanobacteria)]
MIILGDPGAGKSTLLQFLALNWAESTLSNSFSQPIPILIELRTYVRQFDEGRCTNFLDFLHQSSGAICHLNQLKLDEQFKAGNALVMFDGLDEIFDRAKREDIIADIIRFTDKYPSVQVIVTSRVIGYKPEIFRNAEFRHFMLQDFDGEQIQDFINRWHQLAFNDKDDAELKKARLNRALKSSKAIQELAGNPLLLTMMAILSRHRELPRDRSTLYEKAAEVLLQQWDAERYLIDAKIAKFPIDLTDKQAMLRLVAYQMQANEKGLTGNLINGDDLQQIFQGYLEKVGYQKLDARIAAKELINQLRERNFILCHAGDNYYAFVHRTFLEYFCAEAFRRQFEKEQKLTLGELKTEVYGKHWLDEAWDEVLKLIAGALDVKFVGEIIEYLIGIDGEEDKFRNIFLAAGCLAEVRNRSTLKSIDIQLLHTLKTLLEDRYNKKTLTEAEFFINGNLCSHAISAIANTWKDSPETLPWLKKIANYTRSWQVCQSIINELVKEWLNEPDILLKLKKRAKFDDDWLLRIGAVQQLAKQGKKDADSLLVVKRCAQEDRNLNVRRVAIHALGDWSQIYHDSFSILKQSAKFDPAYQVRRAAILEIGKNCPNKPETFDFLRECAITDSCNCQLYWLNPRKTALEIILKHYPNHPHTLPLLQDRAENDCDEQLREWAKKILDSKRQ